MRILVLAALSGCAAPLGAPGLNYEAGPGTGIGPHTVFHQAVGADLASMLTRRLPADVGAGYTADIGNGQPTVQGAYLEGAALSGAGDTRTSVGVRGVLLFANGEVGGGALLRITHELVAPVSTSGTRNTRCGVTVGGAHGTAALGIYVEAGRERTPGIESGWIASAGLSIRTPSLAGVAIGIPYCH